MKKLTNYQRTAQYLNKVFKLINEEYFNNELEVPTITIQSTVGASVTYQCSNYIFNRSVEIVSR